MAGYPLKQRFVIDTSTFLTDEIRHDDEDLERALDRLLDLIADAKLQHNISCYMPPSINDELTTILDDRPVSEETRSKLNAWLIKKNPQRFEVMIPAEIVYGFIDEMSERINRGLRVSEKAVRYEEAASLLGDIADREEDIFEDIADELGLADDRG